MFRIRKGVREYMMETYSDLHFTAPDIYDQKVKASVGTTSEFWELDGRLPEYFHVNIYASTLLYDKLLSPLAPNAMKYYSYHVDSVMGKVHDLQYKISFKPKSKSFQLVSGHMVVSENVWSVREMHFSGRSEMLRFNNMIRMGDVGESDEFCLYIMMWMPLSAFWAMWSMPIILLLSIIKPLFRKTLHGWTGKD